MHKTAILALAFLAAATPAAFASNLGRPCTAAPRSQWLSLDELKAKVEAQGYSVRKAKLNKESCAEIYVLDKGGARIELFLDPTSGQIVGRI